MTVQQGKKLALSFSRLSKIDCPYAFYRHYLAHPEDRFKEPENDAMVVGRIFADLARQYRQRCYENQWSSDTTFWERSDIGSDHPDYQPRFADDLRELASMFGDSPYTHVYLQADFVNIEKRYSFDSNFMVITAEREDDAWYSPETIFRLIPDYAFVIGDTLYIVDDKTGRVEPDSTQLRIMAKLLLRAFYQTQPPDKPHSIDKISATFNMVRTKQRIVKEYEPRDILEVEGWIRDKIAEIEAWKDYPAKACNECRNCKIPECPLGLSVVEQVEEQVQTAMIELGGTLPMESKTKVFSPPEITTKEQQEEVLQFLTFAKRFVTDWEDALKASVKALGPVTACGQVADYFHTETVKPRNLRQFCGALEKVGVPKDDIWDELNLGKREINKLVRKVPQTMRPMITPLIVKEEGSKRWSIKAAQKQEIIPDVIDVPSTTEAA